MTQNSPLSTFTTVYLLFPCSNHQLVCMKSASAPPQRGESLRLRSEHPADVLQHCHSRYIDHKYKWCNNQQQYMEWLLNVSSESATKIANQTNRCKLLRRGFRTLYRPSGPIRHIMLLCDSSILQAAGSAQRHSHQTLNAQFTQMWNISSCLPSPLLPPSHSHTLRPVAAARDAVIQHKNKTFYLSDQIFGGKIWESNYKWFNYNNIIRSVHSR